MFVLYPIALRVRGLAARISFVIAGVLSLYACGGGVGEDGSGASISSVSVGQVSKVDRTTITVNGNEYDISQAKVVNGFNDPLSPEAVKLGVWVDVETGMREAGPSSEGMLVRVRPAARGIVTSVSQSGAMVTLIHSTVTIPSESVIDTSSSGGRTIAVGDMLEVHGELGETPGTFRATRVETLGPEVPIDYEIRGIVSRLNLASMTMVVGAQQVDYSEALLALTSLTNGSLVRVSAKSGPGVEGAWRVARVANDISLPSSAKFFLLGGVTTQTVPSSSTLIEGIPVDLSRATGNDQVVRDGLRVAVIGELEAGIVRAEAVTLVVPGESPVFELRGFVTERIAPRRYRVRGILVDASNATIQGGREIDIQSRSTPATQLVVRGTIRGRTLLASSVRIVN